MREGKKDLYEFDESQKSIKSFRDQSMKSVHLNHVQHQFKINTLSGDASLLQLASQIDRGIRRKLKEKESPRAKKFRKIHGHLLPLKYIILFSYVGLTQFERPDWCRDNVYYQKYGTEAQKEQYKNWDATTCNDPPANNYTNSNLPKLHQLTTAIFEIFCLISLLSF